MDFACTIICRINFSKNQKICQWISFYDKLNNSRQICTLTNCFCKCIFPTSPLMTDGWLVGWYFCHNFLKGRVFTFPCSFSENLFCPLNESFPIKVAPAVRGCGQCQKPIPSVKRSVVWATMHFCTMNCLAAYQDTLSKYVFSIPKLHTFGES